jgi:hypothetical protein
MAEYRHLMDIVFQPIDNAQQIRHFELPYTFIEYCDLSTVHNLNYRAKSHASIHLRSNYLLEDFQDDLDSLHQFLG